MSDVLFWTVRTCARRWGGSTRTGPGNRLSLVVCLVSDIEAHIAYFMANGLAPGELTNIRFLGSISPFH